MAEHHDAGAVSPSGPSLLGRLPPGSHLPTLAAQMAATFQNRSQDALLNVVIAARMPSSVATATSSSTRRRATPAAMSSCRSRTTAVDRRDRDHGEHLQVEGAQPATAWTCCPRSTSAAPRRRPGWSPPARGRLPHLGAAPPAAVAEKIAWCASLPRTRGASLSFGIRMHVIAWDTADAAGWRRGARSTGSTTRPSPRSRPEFLQERPEGQRRCWFSTRATGTTPRSTSNLWAGVGPGPRRRRHRTGRELPGGRGPHRGVPRPRHRRVHPVRCTAPGGVHSFAEGVLLVLASRVAQTNPAPACDTGPRCPSAPPRPMRSPSRRAT